MGLVAGRASLASRRVSPPALHAQGMTPSEAGPRLPAPACPISPHTLFTVLILDLCLCRPRLPCFPALHCMQCWWVPQPAYYKPCTPFVLMLLLLPPLPAVLPLQGWWMYQLCYKRHITQVRR